MRFLIAALFCVLTICTAQAKRGHVILINSFQVKPAQETNFLKAWKRVAAYMKTRSGYLKTKLHRSIDDPTKWVNYAEWESAAQFRQAVESPHFRKLTRNFPAEGSPKLFRIVVVQ